MLSKEKLMARTISIMENIIKEFEKNGRGDFCKKYYQRWIHG
jgi:biotin-(acetyl-CoA carboxylase) ligase